MPSQRVIWGLERHSGEKLLVAQAQGTEFGPPASIQKIGVVSHVCDPRAGAWSPGASA